MAKNVLTHGKAQLIFRKAFDGTKFNIHNLECPDLRAQFAMELLRVHAGITAQLNGEDSSGRSQVRRETPREAVAYACETAELAFNAFKDLNWLIPVPEMG